MSYTANTASIEATIEAVAASLGVDPRLALATAQQESGLDPTSVGDDGTSFGLFQLHQGGELGDLTQAQAFDPTTNAETALSVFANVEQANPDITDPGTIAALAQRPQNPTAYAASIDAIYGNTSDFPGVTASTTAGLTSAGSALGGAAGVVAGGPGAVYNILNGKSSSAPIGVSASGVTGDVEKGGAYLALILAGVTMVVLGVWKVANPGSSVKSIPGQVAKLGASATAV
jgi:hypothetical protein